MGGDQKQTTRSNQETEMGPWGPAQKPLKNILNQAQGIQPFDFSQYMPQIEGLLNSSLSGGGNPFQQQLTDSITNTVNNQVGGQFAAAGRSFSPSHAAALGRSTTDALAPYLFQDARQSQANIPGLFNLASNAPYAGLQSLSNLMLPIASLGQQGETKGMQQTTIPSNPLQTGIGGGLGLLGLLSMGSTGGLGGALGGSAAGLLGV